MVKEINKTPALIAENTPALFKRAANPTEVAVLIAFLLGD
jgi:hypothetical protein